MGTLQGGYLEESPKFPISPLVDIRSTEGGH